MNIWKIIYGVESYPGLRGETGLGKLVPPHKLLNCILKADLHMVFFYLISDFLCILFCFFF